MMMRNKIFEGVKMKDRIHVFKTREAMGVAAGRAVEAKLNELLAMQEVVRVVFAAAPSQNEVLQYLATQADVDWHRVVAFHMDEYVGLKAGAAQLFSSFLTARIFSRVGFKQVHLIDGSAAPAAEVVRYSDLITEAPIDIICLGIGENGHIAFNDPPTADFADPAVLKQVTLDHACRVQQVNDGCFESLEAVPTQALTLSVPALMRGRYLFCVVPGALKQEAVYNTLHQPVQPRYPATILRTHPACSFYFDVDAFGEQHEGDCNDTVL